MIHPQRQTIVQQPTSLLGPSYIATLHRPALGIISLTGNVSQTSELTSNIYKGTDKHQGNGVETPVPHLHSNLSDLTLRINPLPISRGYRKGKAKISLARSYPRMVEKYRLRVCERESAPSPEYQATSKTPRQPPEIPPVTTSIPHRSGKSSFAGKCTSRAIIAYRP